MMNKKIITIATTVTLATVLTMSFTFKNDILQVSSSFFTGKSDVGTGEETKSYPAGLRWTDPFPAYVKKEKRNNNVFAY